MCSPLSTLLVPYGVAPHCVFVLSLPLRSSSASNQECPLASIMTAPGPLCSWLADCILKVLLLASQTLASLTQPRRVDLVSFISMTRAAQQGLCHLNYPIYFQVISVVLARVYQLVFELIDQIRVLSIAQFQLG